MRGTGGALLLPDKGHDRLAVRCFARIVNFLGFFFLPLLVPVSNLCAVRRIEFFFLKVHVVSPASAHVNAQPRECSHCGQLPPPGAASGRAYARHPRSRRGRSSNTGRGGGGRHAHRAATGGARRNRLGAAAAAPLRSTACRVAAPDESGVGLAHHALCGARGAARARAGRERSSSSGALRSGGIAAVRRRRLQVGPCACTAGCAGKDQLHPRPPSGAQAVGRVALRARAAPPVPFRRSGLLLR